jgi:NADH:ubiquinone oxidoreductase subunit 2 (subunit N)
MYFEAPSEGSELPQPTMYAVVVVAVSTVATVLLGVVPASVLGAAARAFKVVLLG